MGGSNSVVESQPSKLLVAGSIPVSRSILRSLRELRMASHCARCASYGWQATEGVWMRTTDLSAEAASRRRSERRRPM